MMFIAYLFFFLVYLAFSIFLVRKAVAAARNRGRKGWKWGLPVAFVMYLIPFWDHVPTLVIHRYLCATEAGLWVYKTPEEWRAANPGIAETLTWREIPTSYHSESVELGFALNERFVFERQRSEVPLFPVSIATSKVIDTQSREEMVRMVTIGSGYGLGDLRFWVGEGECSRDPGRFWSLALDFSRQGRRVE
jgi:hypothetical protein